MDAMEKAVRTVQPDLLVHEEVLVRGAQEVWEEDQEAWVLQE